MRSVVTPDRFLSKAVTVEICRIYVLILDPERNHDILAIKGLWIEVHVDSTLIHLLGVLLSYHILLNRLHDHLSVLNGRFLGSLHVGLKLVQLMGHQTSLLSCEVLVLKLPVRSISVYLLKVCVNYELIVRVDLFHQWLLIVLKFGTALRVDVRIMLLKA